jgi:hypothetical protein
MGRYVISSITEMPGTACQWELVARDGTILRLSYAVGDLTLCEWVSETEAPDRDGLWREVARRARDDLPVFERLRDCTIALDEAISMLGDMLSVTSYVASYELTSAAGYNLRGGG